MADVLHVQARQDQRLIERDQRDLALFALDAVAIDTETTGLDPRNACIIEIGGVEVAHGAGAPHTFTTLVNGGTIPDAAQAITGITPDMTAGAPSFPQAYEAMLAFVRGRVVIGHSFGFDLAVFREEARRAGLPAWTPIALDTRFLAQIAFPNLPAYTLEIIAARCGVELDARHRALGDAVSCARVFTALGPHLRERGVRTLGEAIAATRRFEQDQSYPSVWAPLTGPQTQGVAPAAIVDTFLFERRVSDIMSRAPLFVAPEAPLGEAIATMARAKVGSIFVGEAHAVAGDLGVVTERDLLTAIAAHGPDALARGVGDFASRPLVTVAAQAFAYRAVGRMNRLGIRHLGVADETGRIVGALSARDLLRSRMSEPVALGDAIDTAPDVIALGKAWGTIPSVARGLVAYGMDGQQVAAVIAREVAALTRRAAQLAEQALMEQGAGPPPCRYTVVVLGSAGRGESLLAFDQDNAIVFERGDPDGPEDAWFARLATLMCDLLHAVGVPYCRGGVMAKNAPWRGSVATWRERARLWLTRSRPEDLLAVDIAFDMRPCHGDLMLAETLWRDMWRAARREIPFLKLLAEAGAEQASPFGFFGRLQTREGMLDLKRTGLKPIVTGARVLALRAGVEARATAERLAGVRSLGEAHSTDLEALARAHGRFLTFILARQLEDIAAGQAPGNKIAPASLDAGAMEDLRAGLKAAQTIPEIVRDCLSS